MDSWFILEIKFELFYLHLVPNYFFSHQIFNEKINRILSWKYLILFWNCQFQFKLVFFWNESSDLDILGFSIIDTTFSERQKMWFFSLDLSLLCRISLYSFVFWTTHFWLKLKFFICFCSFIRLLVSCDV